MRREPYEVWEDKFLNLFEERMDEEAIYPYEHLWKKSLNAEQAFVAYLEENPDYAEKFSEISPEVASESERADFLKLAKKLEQQKLQQRLQQEAEEKLSKFCPECARIIDKRSVCKCGYRRPKKKN